MWQVLAELAIVETDRLILRPFRFSDQEDLFAILSDPDNVQFIYPLVPTLAACQTLMVEAFMRQPLGVWALEDKVSGRMIGAIRLEQIRVKERKAEVGYFLHREFWKRGLMTEALESIVFIAFRRLGIAELIIKTHEENSSSQQLAKRVGFSLYRRYKGSDRYTHQMRCYQDYRYLRKDYQLKEDR